MNGWACLFSLSKLNLSLGSYLLRSGRIQFQSFLAGFSFPSSGFKNNLRGLYGIHKRRDYSGCSPFSQLYILYNDATGQIVLHYLADDGVPGRLRDALPVVLFTQHELSHRTTMTALKPQCQQQASTTLSQTSPYIWYFVHIGHRSLLLMETHKILPNPASVREENPSFEFWPNPFISRATALVSLHEFISPNRITNIFVQVLYNFCF